MTDKEFPDRQNEILSVLPQEFHGAVSHYAWEQGHAYGYEEVLIHLEELVDMLNVPIQNYRNRIDAETYGNN